MRAQLDIKLALQAYLLESWTHILPSISLARNENTVGGAAPGKTNEHRGTQKGTMYRSYSPHRMGHQVAHLNPTEY